MSKQGISLTRRGMILFAVSSLIITGIVAGYVTQPAFASTPVTLGTAGSFAVLAHSGITNTGTTSITGDVGSYPNPSETGFGSVTIHGTNYPAGAPSTTQTDLANAITQAMGYTPTTILTALDTQNLVAGVYKAASTTFTLSGGVLTLDGQGVTTGIWIFQAPFAGAGALSTTGGHVVLKNGANSCNVFWVTSAGGATIGTSTSFVGEILAYSSVTLATGVTLRGAALANTGDVTMDTNNISNRCLIAPTATTTTTTTTAPTTTTHTTTPTTSTTSSTTTTTTTTSSLPNTCESPQSPVSLTVNTEIANGSALAGIYVLYNCFDGQTTTTAFSPATFTNVPPGLTHVVGVLDFGCFVFDHWSDTGSNLRFRNFSITADTTFTAVFSNGCSPTLSPSTSTITVNSVDLSGAPITGVYTTLWQNGTLLQICFTTCSMTVNNGNTYQVAVGDFGNNTFDHWTDGTLSRFHTVVVGNVRTTFALTAAFALGPSTTVSTIEVNLIDGSGNALTGTGFFSTLWQNGALLENCFAPCSFTVNNGQTYQVGVADFGAYTFSHWTDGTTTRLHTEVIGSTSTIIPLTAVLTTGTGSTTTTSTTMTAATSGSTTKTVCVFGCAITSSTTSHTSGAHSTVTSSNSQTTSNQSGQPNPNLLGGDTILALAVVAILALAAIAALAIRRVRRPKRIP